MADIEQWVNLTRNNKWIGDGLTSRARMGRIAPLNIQFDQHHRATVWITKEADGGNAVYSATELPRRTVFRAPPYVRRRVSTDRRGRLNLDINLTAAGGDKFTIRVEDRDGNELQSDVLHVRRKLYFQIIKMAGVAAVSAGDVAGMQNEYWNTAENVYIKMIEHSGGRTITARRNFDDTNRNVNRSVKRAARRQYVRDKNPYSFAVLVVRRNGIPGTFVGTDNNATFDASNTYTFTAEEPKVDAAGNPFMETKVLFDYVDPAEEYYDQLWWQPTGGVAVQIPKARLVRGGPSDVTIDTTGFVQGAGQLIYRMRHLDINGRGLSLPTENLTVVAAEDAETGVIVPTNEVMGVLVHEMGHKIGMVPGPQGSPVMDQQATYYDGRGHSGGHCHHGVATPLPADLSTTGGIAPDCTMFGDTRAATSNYCPDCRASLRKLDLRSRTNVGIRTQF